MSARLINTQLLMQSNLSETRGRAHRVLDLCEPFRLKRDSQTFVFFFQQCWK